MEDIETNNRAELITLSVDQITTYRHNVRLSPNPKRTELKQSIRHQGLLGPLTVTQPPGSDKYTIAKGGNTRLELLGELFHETGDPQFKRVSCFVVPYKTEMDLLIGHYVENDARGETTFIEKSILVNRVVREIRKPGDGYREISGKLDSVGIRAHYTTLPVMEYAEKRLYPFAPEALKAGMGRPAIQKIAAIEKAFISLFESLQLPSEAAKELISEGLEYADHAGLDFQELRTAISNTKTIRNISKTTKEIIEFNTDIIFHNPSAYKKQTSIGLKDFQLEISPTKKSRARKKEDASKPESILHHEIESKGQNDIYDLPSLRKSAFQMAFELADSSFSNKDVVQVDIGYGFAVDLPEQKYQNTIEGCLWWALFSLSGMPGCSSSDAYYRIKKLKLERLEKRLAESNWRGEDYRTLLKIISHHIGIITGTELLVFSEQYITHPELTSEEQEKFCSLLMIIKRIRGQEQLWEHKK